MSMGMGELDMLGAKDEGLSEAEATCEGEGVTLKDEELESVAGGWRKMEIKRQVKDRKSS